MKGSLKSTNSNLSRCPSELNTLGVVSLMLTFFSLPVGAATVVQTFTYDSTDVLIDSAVVGTDETFYQVSDGSTDPILLAQPFDSSLGTLESFTISLALDYDGFQTNGAIGSGFSISSGGSITLDGIDVSGTGNGSGNGGAPFSNISATVPINFSHPLLVADAGDTYDPAILTAVQGGSPFEVRFEHNPSISPADDATSFRYEVREGSQISLTYNYEPIPEPGSATLGLLAGLFALAQRRRR